MANKLTRHRNGKTILTAKFLNGISGGLYDTEAAVGLDPKDPLVSGHVHDGEHADGHAQKINLSNHVTGKLDGSDIKDGSIPLDKLAETIGTGAQGAQGFQGASGDGSGPQGFQGDTGATGSQGFQGNIGATGSQGSQGSQGDTGAAGAAGAAGSQGFQGATGATGSQGDTGAAGSQGFQGATGSQGDTGAAGSQGSQGFQGATGSQGDTGAAGSQGSQGFQGATGSQGSIGPASLQAAYEGAASLTTSSAEGDLILTTGTGAPIQFVLTGDDLTINGANDVLIGNSSPVSSFKLDTSGIISLDSTSVSTSNITTSGSNTISTTGENSDLTLSTTGLGTSQVIIESAGSGANAIRLNATGGGINIDANSNIIIDSSAGNLNLGNASNDGAINIGTGTTAGRIVTVGNTTGTTAVNINSGTGNILLDSPNLITLDSTTTRIVGNLIVEGTTTYIESENTSIGENYLYLNSNYTNDAAQQGGIIFNYDPTTIADTIASPGFTAGVASVSNPTVQTVGSATFSVADIIQISGTGDPDNNGLFEVLSHSSNVLTIKGVGLTGKVENFTRNQFDTSTSTTGNITKVSVSVLKTDSSGTWEVGKGNSTPFTFTPLATTSSTTLQTSYENGNTITTSSSEGALSITTGASAPVNFILTGDDLTVNGANDVLIGNSTAVSSFTVDTSGVISLDSTSSSSSNFTTVGSNTISTTGSNSDLTLTATGTGTSQVIIESAGTGNNAIRLNSSAGGINADAAGNIFFNSSTGNINIGNSANSGDINIGTGAAARAITVGNTTSTSSATFRTGTGSMTFTAGGIFDVNSTGAVTIDSSGGNISMGTDVLGGSQDINIGTGASERRVTIGNTTGNTYVEIDGASNITLYSTKIIGGIGGVVNEGYSAITNGQTNTVASGSGGYNRVGGKGAVARNFAEDVYSSGSFNTLSSRSGDSQRVEAVWFGETTTNTADQEIFLDGSSARYVIPTYSSLKFAIEVSCIMKGSYLGVDRYFYAGFSIGSLISRAGGSTTTLNSSIVVVPFRSTDVPLTVMASVDNTKSSTALSVVVTPVTSITVGEQTYTISSTKWSATMTGSLVRYV